LAALIRPIFNAENLAGARDKLAQALATLEGTLPKVAGVLEAAEDDIVAFYAFPADHWAQGPKHQPAGALQPRDRTRNRRRGCLPRRPQPDPPSLDARHRAER
jgi:putative transposase